MVDCGSHSEKECPVNHITNSNQSWLNIKPYVTQSGKSYNLTLLHITHPDDDHVRNAKKIKESLAPYLLHRRKWEEFPNEEIIHEDYKEHIDNQYRGSNPETIPWGFSQNKVFQIPMDVVKGDLELSKKIKNNSSILRFIESGGRKVLFCGDLEKAGWDWLTTHDKGFIETMNQGIDILVAPHHGHKSGFPTSLFYLTGKVEISILSKGSEAEKDGTDVSSQYAANSNGLYYKNLSDKNTYFASGTLTTRSNGHIFLEITDTGNMNIFTEAASPNHTSA